MEELWMQLDEVIRADILDFLNERLREHWATCATCHPSDPCDYIGPLFDLVGVLAEMVQT